jgi:hypothetical protein
MSLRCRATMPRPGEANTSPINNRFVKRTGTAF